MVFTASVTGLLFYFDQRDMKKEMVFMQEDIADLKIQRKEDRETVELVKSMVSVVQDLKDNQGDMKKDFNDRLDRQEGKLDNFISGYWNRVPRQ